MTEHLTENFVHLRRVELGAERASELPLDHAHGRLDVAPLVVVRQELGTLEAVEVEETVPRLGSAVHAVALERNEGRCARGRDCREVRVRQVCLVRAHLGHAETVRGRRLHEAGKLGAVVHGALGNFHGRHHVRQATRHHVRLEPRVFAHIPPVLGIEPAAVDVRGEARRVYRKLGLDTRQRGRALLDERLQDRRQLLAVHVLEDRVVGRRTMHHAPILALADVRRGAASRDSRIDLGDAPVNDVRHRQRLWAAPLVWRRCHVRAEVAKERLDNGLLLALSTVVRRPVLRIRLPRDLDGLGDGRGTVRLHLDDLEVLDREDVFALAGASLVVEAGTRLRLDIDDVAARVRLRRTEPDGPVHVLQALVLGQQPPTLLSYIHETQCSYDVASRQGKKWLTCSHTALTLWPMSKQAKRAKANPLTKPNKDDVVRMRVTGEQKTALVEAASRDGLELSQWLRQLALRAAGVLPSALEERG